MIRFIQESYDDVSEESNKFEGEVFDEEKDICENDSPMIRLTTNNNWKQARPSMFLRSLSPTKEKDQTFNRTKAGSNLNDHLGKNHELKKLSTEPQGILCQLSCEANREMPSEPKKKIYLNISDSSKSISAFPTTSASFPSKKSKTSTHLLQKVEFVLPEQQNPQSTEFDLMLDDDKELHQTKIEILNLKNEDLFMLNNRGGKLPLTFGHTNDVLFKFPMNTTEHKVDQLKISDESAGGSLESRQIDTVIDIYKVLQDNVDFALFCQDRLKERELDQLKKR